MSFIQSESHRTTQYLGMTAQTKEFSTTVIYNISVYIQILLFIDLLDFF